MNDDAHTATLQAQGWQFSVPPGADLVSAAQAAGIRLPRSCRNGTCRTCLCRLVEGEVRYRVEWPGISSDERVERWILPCVAVPCTDVVLDVAATALDTAGRRSDPPAAPVRPPGPGETRDSSTTDAVGRPKSR